MPRQVVDVCSGGAPRRLGAALVLGVSVLVASPAVMADEAAGLRVFKDPVTGQLRAPTHEEVRALQLKEAQAKSARTVAAGRVGMVSRTVPVLVQRADGSRKLELTEESLSYSVVTRNADGSLDMSCVTGADTAERVVKGKKFAATRIVKEDGHGQQ